MDILLNERSVFGDLNAINELELLGNFDRTIITPNSANILNILSESSALNPEEEVIRKRGRKKTPKISQLPLRRSPRKSATIGDHSRSAIESSPARPQSDASHEYFLRTPSKRSPTKWMNRTPGKTPSKSSAATPSTPRRISPRKRLQLDGNDSGLGLTPSPGFSSGHESTPNVANGSHKTPAKAKSPKSLIMTRRRRRRYF